MPSNDMISSVDRALEVLLYLYREGHEMGITQIANGMGIYKSTIFRTLATLEARGFVKKNQETDRYWLGPQLFLLGKAVENSMGLQDTVRPYAQRLYGMFGEVVNVTVMDRVPNDVYHGVIILKEESANQVLKANPPIGSRNECHCSSVGKCLLAFSKDIDLSVYDRYGLTPHTANTITTTQALREELERVRANGYALDQEELELGLTCIGAPILDRNGYAVAAISLSGPTSRMMADGMQRIQAVCQVAAEVSGKF